MNIFQNRENIIGSLDSVAANGSLVSLFQLVKQIRSLLGNQAYRLDCYLSTFFEGMKETTAIDVAKNGFMKNIELQYVFLGLLEDTDEGKSNPLYNRAKELFDKQADELPFQEPSTKILLMMIQLADELMIGSTESFIKEQVSNFDAKVDKVVFRSLYNTISDVVGEAMLDELNEKLKQRFLLVPLTAIFAQSINNELIFRLTTRDFETSKQMFQLMIDILPDTP